MSDSDEDDSSQGSKQDTTEGSSDQNLDKKDIDKIKLAKLQLVQDDILLLRDIVSYAQNVNKRITRNNFSISPEIEKSSDYRKMKPIKNSKKVSVDESSRLEKALHVLMNSDMEGDSEH